MCAVCMDGRSVEGRKVRVGCDVEKIGQLKMNIAMRYFCKEEYGAIKEAGSDEEKTDLFFRYWVLKESFMKATGKGMAPSCKFFLHLHGRPADPCAPAGRVPGILLLSRIPCQWISLQDGGVFHGRGY